MVVITAWKSKPLGRSRLLKAVCKMTKQLTAEAKINLEDISMIIHGGVYRRHFRTEPAFATHVQGELDLKCGSLKSDSTHCFSFDVSDGSCSPYVALKVAKNMLHSLKGGYALVTIGDERPNRQSEWGFNPMVFVALVSLEGGGLKLKSVEFDNTLFDSNNNVVTEFDLTKSANIIKRGNNNSENLEKVESIYTGNIDWLSGRHIHQFLSIHQKNPENKIHRIVDSSGKVVTAFWE